MINRINRFNKKNSYTRQQQEEVKPKTKITKGVKKEKKPKIIHQKAIPFLVFDCYQNQEKKLKCIPDGKYIIAAIDPAIKNCAVRVEDENKQTLLQTKFNFVSKDNLSKTSYYENLNTKFREILPILSKCHFILIESQMPINTEMVRISQAIITFLMSAFSMDPLYADNNPVIVELDPKLKSCVVDPTLKSMKKPELKKWAAQKGLDILKENGDEDTFNFVTKEKKKDDHGDVICYVYAWRKMMLDKDYENIIYHY